MKEITELCFTSYGCCYANGSATRMDLNRGNTETFHGRSIHDTLFVKIWCTPAIGEINISYNFHPTDFISQ